MKIAIEQSHAVLIEYFAKQLVGKLNGGESPAYSFDENGRADVAHDFMARIAYCTDDISRESLVEQTPMHGWNKNVMCMFRRIAPVLRREILSSHLRNDRQRREQAAVGIGDEHPIDARLRVKGRA